MRIAEHYGEQVMKKHLFKISLAIFIVVSVLITGCGDKKIDDDVLEVQTATVDDENVFKITTIEELPAAIAPDTVIELSAGKWNLADAFGADYSGDKKWEFAYLEYTGEGYGLVIRDVSNLTIRGASADKTELVIEDPYADVLKFENCNDITLEKMTLGHDVEPGHCVGAVVELEKCSDCMLKDMDLYGCGTYGVEANDCAGIILSNSTIRNCSYGILYAYGSEMAVDNCELKDCNGYTDIDAYDSTMTFTDCNFDNNVASNGLLSTDSKCEIFFKDCKFSNTESYDIMYGLPEGDISFESCKFDESVKLPNSKIVYVYSMEELFDAIAPDTTIVVMGGWHNMSDWMEETYAQKGDAWNQAHLYVDLEEVFDGTMATIKDVKNLAIVGPYSSRFAVNIMTNPRYADVLSFKNCENLYLANMSVGHTDTGYCTGSVVMLNECDNVVIDNCDLYGCGVEGINANYVCNLTVTNTHIRDCSNVALMIEQASGEVYFKDCDFYDNDGGFRYWSDVPMVFEHCKLGMTESRSAKYHSDIELIDCELMESDWEDDWDNADVEEEWYYPDVEEEYDYHPLEGLSAISFDSEVLRDSVWNVFYCEGETCKNLLDMDTTTLIFDMDGKHCTLTGFLDGHDVEMSLEYGSSGYVANAYEETDHQFPDGYIYLYSDLNSEESNLTMQMEYLEGFLYLICK